MEGKNEKLFRSSFFRRLFLSYVLLILFEMLLCFRENFATVQSFRSWDPLTDGYEGVATARRIS